MSQGEINITIEFEEANVEVEELDSVDISQNEIVDVTIILAGNVGPPGKDGEDGEQGPPGDPGSSESFNYTHDQGVPSTTWNINHDLNGFPNVTVVDSAGTQVEGNVVYVDANNMTISFSAAFSGKAYLS